MSVVGRWAFISVPGLVCDNTHLSGCLFKHSGQLNELELSIPLSLMDFLVSLFARRYFASPLTKALTLRSPGVSVAFGILQRCTF